MRGYFTHDINFILERGENIETYTLGKTRITYEALLTLIRTLFNKYPNIFQDFDLGDCRAFWRQVLFWLMHRGFCNGTVEFVKYCPEVIRVENVYNYSHEKHKRIQYHLRILIKALLDELMRLKLRIGCEKLEIDEGVLEMIKAELDGIISVEDILAIFRSIPRIVEVEKIVEKIVERVIEVPHIINIENTV